MAPECWHRVEELYHAAVECDPEERAALLAAADAEIRAEVEALLAQENNQGLLDRPAADLLSESGAASLAAGAQLGPYRIEARVGAGGMGEVFRATDTRLHRTVAIKILPRGYVGDAGRRRRFLQEARAASALNHPHICGLYDIGNQDGTDYLVMEWLEGETLEVRLRDDPLCAARCFQVAMQVAEALDHAHQRGLVHRDVKPGNIMLTKAGAKLLDFGLAKPMAAAAAAGTTLTQEGTVMGTVQYMAPEQLRGMEADARSDIFAFGAVLYEMITGRQAFGRQTTPATIEAILHGEPEPVSALEASTTGGLASVAARCLQKDPSRRFQSMKEVLNTLAQAQAEIRCVQLVPSGPRSAGANRLGRYLPWAVAGAMAMAAVAVAALSFYHERLGDGDRPLTRLSVDLGAEAMVGRDLTVAVSPDGRRVVFPARGADGRQRLATRLFDQVATTLVPGTEGAVDPFFSPDGQWIGFVVDGHLRKISVQGGPAMPLGEILGTISAGAVWDKGGDIIAAVGNLDPLARMPDHGGPMRLLTKLAPGEVAHRWPQVLPGGNAVLFTASSSISDTDNANIEALSLKTGQTKIVQRGGYYGRYLPSGHLVYVHQGVLFGVGFDFQRLEALGTPVPILEDVAANPATGGGQFDFSNTGTFVYLPGKGQAQEWRIDWLDGSGKLEPLISAPGAYIQPRFSPDGRKLAFGDGSDFYIHDLERGTTSQITSRAAGTNPVWAPDSKHIVFRAAGDRFSIVWVRSDGAGDPQRLLENSVYNVFPWSMSPDGRLVYVVSNPDTGFDIWVLPLDLADPDHPKPGKPEPFLCTPAAEKSPRLSPDGRWIAYVSNESGSNEIYVRPFPAGSGAKWQISSSGALGALYVFWSSNGRELFYETADSRIMVVDYTVEGGTFRPGKPRLWSGRQLFFTGAWNLDLAPDGSRFVALSLPEAAPGAQGSVHVTILQNFFDELKRRIPLDGK